MNLKERIDLERLAFLLHSLSCSFPWPHCKPIVGKKYYDMASVVRQEILAAIEEAAQVADNFEGGSYGDWDGGDARHLIANAIREATG